MTWTDLHGMGLDSTFEEVPDAAGAGATRFLRWRASDVVEAYASKAEGLAK